jgi:hypothetical protein
MRQASPMGPISHGIFHADVASVEPTQDIHPTGPSISGQENTNLRGPRPEQGALRKGIIVPNSRAATTTKTTTTRTTTTNKNNKNNNNNNNNDDNDNDNDDIDGQDRQKRQER